METETNNEVVSKKRRIRVQRRKIVVKDWKDEDIFKLISLVEARSCLWNTGDANYNNKTARGKAWRSICKEIGVEYLPYDLVAKWTNLRINYWGYNARAKLRSAKGIIKPLKWRFYKALGFIGHADGRDQTKHTTSTKLMKTENSSYCKYSSKPSPQSPSPQPQSPLPETQPSPTPSLLTLLQQQPSRSSRDSSLTPSPPPQVPVPKPSHFQNFSAAAVKTGRTMREAVVELRKRKQNTLDPNSSMANYMVSELRTLSGDAAAKVRQSALLNFVQCLEELRRK